MSRQSHSSHQSQQSQRTAGVLRTVVSWVGRTTRLGVGALALVLLVTPTTASRVELATSTYLCTGYAG